MNRSSFDRAGLALMLSTILVWAGSWIAMKLIVPYIGLRLRGAALCDRRRRAVRAGPGHAPAAGHAALGLTLLIGLTQTAGFQGFVQTALVSGGVGKVSLMAYTMPFWVVLFAWWLLRERPTVRHAAGIGLAAIGLVCFVEPWNGLGDIKPVLLGLGSGLCWGVGTVLSKRMFERHRPDVMVFTAWQMLLGGLVMAPVAWMVPQIPAQWGWQLSLGMIYIVFIATAAGWLLWLQVVRRVPASIAGLSSLGVPVVAMLLAWALLSERPGGAELAGMALILAGIWVVSRAAPPGRQ